MPSAPTATELLALLTRVRSVRVAQGDINAKRLHDLRAFKTCWAELSYLHRLAAGGRHGGTVVTSMRQLVAGLARIHPAWKLTGDPWEDRDRHHQAVRRRLSALQAAGLLRWRIGLDEDLEERRTELQLLPVPELMPDELTAAAEQLARWETRYGPDLNTGSPIGIKDVKRTAAPLSEAERRRRGCSRTRRNARATHARGVLQSISAPPYGAPPTSENNHMASRSHRTEQRNAYRHRTGARAHATSSPKALRPSQPNTPAQLEKAATRKKAILAGGESIPWQQHVVKRVEARRAIAELKERQAMARAMDVAKWNLDRPWPVSRLKEAWVVARHGAGEAVLHGGRAAGLLVQETPTAAAARPRGLRDDYLTLRRAVARYERNHTARPEGLPCGGLAALLRLGVLAREGDQTTAPMLLSYAIGALDQLSRRMRALATADSAQRHKGQARRANARHPTGADRPTYRTGPWPPWVVLDAEGLPALRLTDRFEEVLVTSGAGAPSAQFEREVLRDAILLRYGTLPPTSTAACRWPCATAGSSPPPSDASRWTPGSPSSLASRV